MMNCACNKTSSYSHNMKNIKTTSRRIKSMQSLFVTSICLYLISLSSASNTNVNEKINDNGNGNGYDAPSAYLAYRYAQDYVRQRDTTLQQKYFPDNNDDDGMPLPLPLMRVRHLIIGRGVAGTNIFASRYTKVEEYEYHENPYTCDDGRYSSKENEKGRQCKGSDGDEGEHEDGENLYLHDIDGDGSDVLIVGDEVTGLWNDATFTLAQPLSALTFPYLPYNPVDFVGEVNPARVERDEYVSCVDMHRALLASQCAIRAPVLSALAIDVQLASGRNEECVNDGGKFVVKLEQITDDDKVHPKGALLCVDEIDIATGRGVPRSVFRGVDKDMNFTYPITGVDKDVYTLMKEPKSSGFGEAPALVEFREFIFEPDEEGLFATPNEDGKKPTIIIDGGGGTILAAIRRALLATDDISKNIVYTDPDSTFGETKNPQMIRKVLREPKTQNAIVKWVSRADLNAEDLRGENQVRSGSAYSIVDLFGSTSSAESIYGSLNFFWSLCCIDFEAGSNGTRKFAIFCPYPKDKDCTCCSDEKCPTALKIEFDQFVSCVGEDDTEERKELYDKQRFGSSVNLHEFVQPGFPFAYAVGFNETGLDLRIFGAAATNKDLFPRDFAGETFSMATQMYANGGQVVPLQFTGNMLSMISQLQVYTSTVLKKRIAKINLSMSTSQFILRFLSEACVPSEARNEFVNYLQFTNNKPQTKNNIEWPLNPNGIGETDLKKYIQSHEGLSNNIFVSRGRTLVSKHDQPCSGEGGGQPLPGNGDEDDAGGGNEVIVPPTPPCRLLKIIRSSLAQTVVVLMAYCGLMFL